MAITFHPGYGTLLYCDFSHQEAPEMVKARPVVVLSRRNANISLCTVVPLSGTEPNPILPWHHKMDASKLPLPEHDWWAKCDCIASVSFKRLDRVKLGKDPRTGKRVYYTQKVYSKDLEAIKIAVANHLGMSDLISAPN